MILLALKRPQEALFDFEWILRKVSPSHRLTMFQRSIALKDLGRTEEALEGFEDTVHFGAIHAPELVPDAAWYCGFIWTAKAHAVGDEIQDDTKVSVAGGDEIKQAALEQAGRLTDRQQKLDKQRLMFRAALFYFEKAERTASNPDYKEKCRQQIELLAGILNIPVPAPTKRPSRPNPAVQELWNECTQLSVTPERFSSRMRQLCTRLIEMDPQGRPEYYQWRCRCFEVERQLPFGILDLETALKLSDAVFLRDPDSQPRAFVYLDLARCSTKQNDLDGTMRYLTNAIQECQRPEHNPFLVQFVLSSTLQKRLRIYAHRQDYNNAVADAEWIVRLNPKNVRALRRMGVIYNKSGRSADSVRVHARADEIEGKPSSGIESEWGRYDPGRDIKDPVHDGPEKNAEVKTDDAKPRVPPGNATRQDGRIPLRHLSQFYDRAARSPYRPASPSNSIIRDQWKRKSDSRDRSRSRSRSRYLAKSRSRSRSRYLAKSRSRSRSRSRQDKSRRSKTRRSRSRSRSHSRSHSRRRKHGRTRSRSRDTPTHMHKHRHRSTSRARARARHTESMARAQTRPEQAVGVQAKAAQSLGVQARAAQTKPAQAKAAQTKPVQAVGVQAVGSQTKPVQTKAGVQVPKHERDAKPTVAPISTTTPGAQTAQTAHSAQKVARAIPDSVDEKMVEEVPKPFDMSRQAEQTRPMAKVADVVRASTGSDIEMKIAAELKTVSAGLKPPVVPPSILSKPASAPTVPLAQPSREPTSTAPLMPHPASTFETLPQRATLEIPPSRYPTTQSGVSAATTAAAPGVPGTLSVAAGAGGSKQSGSYPDASTTPQVVGEWLSAFAPLYQPYRQAAIDNGLNGEMLHQIRTEKTLAGAIPLFQAAGITNALHQRRIWTELQK